MYICHLEIYEKMRHLNKIVTLCFCAALLLVSCTKYGTAVSTISYSFDKVTKQLTVNAQIIDNGGCDYYMEQGFCYSLFTPPDMNDIFTTQVKVNGYSEVDTFSTTFNLPLADTAYYVRAYVKNSAGLSYSDVKKVSTNPLDYPEE
jgi:hypothetical protein